MYKMQNRKRSMTVFYILEVYTCTHPCYICTYGSCKYGTQQDHRNTWLVVGINLFLKPFACSLSSPTLFHIII